MWPGIQMEAISGMISVTSVTEMTKLLEGNCDFAFGPCRKPKVK